MSLGRDLVTPEHPVFVRDRGWTPAGEVVAGDELATLAGEWRAVESNRSTGETATVYNLRVADWHTYFVGDDHWPFALWVHNTYKMTAGEWRKLRSDFKDWASTQQLSKAQRNHVWGLVRQAKKHSGGMEHFWGEVNGIVTTIERFHARGARLIPKGFGYGSGGRYGVDLVFRQRVGAQVLDHVVDAKGYSMFGRLGQRALANKSGGRGWAMHVLQRAADEGSFVAESLMNRAREGRTRFYTSFLDGLHQW